MPSPQKENGYTPIANEIMDALASIRISGEQMQCLMVILRKTYGWNKKSDEISLGQFAELTGIKRPHIVRAIQGLQDKNIITVTKNGNTSPSTYQFNKQYKKWKLLPKKVTVPKNGNKGVPNNGTHKRQYKDNIPRTFFDLSKRFHEYQKNQLGDNLVKTDKKTVEQGAIEIDRLVRIDGFNLESEIRPALQWGVQDSFWASQLRSLASIRKAGKNGESKFKNLYASYKANKPQKKKVEIVY